MIFKTGKMMEESIVSILENQGALVKQEGQEHIEITRMGVPISGYVDGIYEDGHPIEIKTFYGDYQLRELEAGKPRESYLKQLAIYMDALNKDEGELFYIHRGTGHMISFTLERKTNTVFVCGDVTIDLREVYSRWKDLYQNHILPKVEPVCEYRYKIPVEEIDWRTVSKSNISKARNGHKIIGDHPWAIQYSDYKDLIIQKEGSTPSYSEQELAIIRERTTGYTKWA